MPLDRLSTKWANVSYDCRTGAWKSLLWLGISDTLTILRVLQSLLSTSTSLALLKAFDVIAWILIKKSVGIRTLRLLGLSSATATWGVLGLLFSKHTKALDKMAAAAKITLITMMWASGILLFAKTKVTQVNQTISTYNVTAGVGIFRGAYVAEFLERLQTTNAGYNLSILPYSIITTASHLVVNPIHSLTTVPVSCDKGKRCDSYLMPGGLIMSTPWPPSNHEDYPTITIYDAPATQIDFVRNGEQENMFIDSRDCLVYGSDDFVIGMQFCLAESTIRPGSLRAGTQRRCPKMIYANMSRPIRLPEWNTCRRVYHEHKSA